MSECRQYKKEAKATIIAANTITPITKPATAPADNAELLTSVTTSGAMPVELDELENIVL